MRALRRRMDVTLSGTGMQYIVHRQVDGQKGRNLAGGKESCERKAQVTVH
jgi:hypothetical protein